MPKEIRQDFMGQLAHRFGKVKRLGGSLSLFEIGGGAARVYIRYSKLHQRNQAFSDSARLTSKNLKGIRR